MYLGLKYRLKAAVQGLTNTQKAVLTFAVCVIPPVITWFEQVGTGAEVTTASLALLGAAIFGGILAFAVKMLDNDSY